GTTAGYDGSVTGGAGLTVKATGVYTATVDSKPIAIGIIAGVAAASDASITTSATVNAGIGSDAKIDVGNSNKVNVEAHVTNKVKATMDSASFGGLDITVMFARAHDRGGSKASFDGELVSAKQLNVTTDVSRSVASHLIGVA